MMQNCLYGINSFPPSTLQKNLKINITLAFLDRERQYYLNFIFNISSNSQSTKWNSLINYIGGKLQQSTTTEIVLLCSTFPIKKRKKKIIHLGEEPILHHLCYSWNRIPKLCCLQSTTSPAVTEYFRTLTFQLAPRSSSGLVVTMTCKLLITPISQSPGLQYSQYPSLPIPHQVMSCGEKPKKKST